MLKGRFLLHVEDEELALVSVGAVLVEEGQRIGVASDMTERLRHATTGLHATERGSCENDNCVWTATRVEVFLSAIV